MMTVMKIVRPSARLFLANTCFCKTHLEFILFKPIMWGSGRPTGGRLNYGQKRYSVQCDRVAEASVCHVRAERSVQYHFLSRYEIISGKQFSIRYYLVLEYIEKVRNRH